MSYLVRTRKTFPDSHIPHSDSSEVFDGGPAVDKWNEMLANGKLVSANTTQVTDNVYEEEMIWLDEAAWLEYANVARAEKDTNMPLNVNLIVIERRAL